MPVSRKDGRRLTGYIGDVNPVVDTEQEVPEVHVDSDHEQEEEEVDDTSSELSIPDAEIDFDMVYALYTFAATVEGQASIVKGDALTLLDDTNSYWWLVKVLKTAEIGYIPAEIIETPYERLARLNSHRNAQLTLPDNNNETIINKKASTRSLSKQQRRVTLSRAVQFQSQIMFNLSDDEEEYEVEYDHWQIDRDDDDDDKSITSTIEEEDPYHFYHQEEEEAEEYPVFDSPINEEFDSKSTPIKEDASEWTRLKIYAGHNFEQSHYFNINIHTTTTDLIEDAFESFDIYDVDEKDYYLGVQSMSGDDYTLIPTDKPLDIYHSLTNNTPMPSLKKARRISQLMSSHLGQKHQQDDEETAKFYLYSKPRRHIEEEGEIQIKVTLKNQHKLIKIPPATPVMHATSFLLERFHVLDGAAMGQDRDSLNMGSQDVVTYQLYLYDNKKEYILPSSATISEVLGNQMPPIQYRRHSNLNRLSVSISISQPNENETYFILKPVQKPVEREKQQAEGDQKVAEDTQQVTVNEQQVTVNEQQVKDEQVKDEQVQNQNSEPVIHHHRPTRHDTPMPRREKLSTPEPISDKPPQITFTSESPIDLGFESPEPLAKPRPKSTESMIFHNDFGMRDLMILIREKSRPDAPKPRKSTIANLRGEITHVFKDTHTRLDQLEKELDDILAIAINMP